jgi:hypothetical protein
MQQSPSEIAATSVLFMMAPVSQYPPYPSACQSSALLLVVATIPSGEDHLVLIVVTDRGDYVLDNLRANVALIHRTILQK